MLQNQTKLQCVPAVEIQFDSNGRIGVSWRGGSAVCGPHALAILEAFANPETLEAALAALQPKAKGPLDWSELNSDVHRLHDVGVLAEIEGPVPSTEPTGRGYGGARVHTGMLNDRARTSAYLEAIRSIVKPGDTVVEIGPGTGILSVAAVQAGAAKVYAIEASPIADVAQAVFEANGVDDRVRLIRGWSSHVDLPERVDVLVAELIGNDPFGERVLEVTADAINRFLKPEARLIPGGVDVFVTPVEVPYELADRETFTLENADRWKDWYGVDFTPLAELACSRGHTLFVPTPIPQSWKRLAEPTELVRIDLARSDQRMPDGGIPITATSSGVLNGLLIHFRLQMGAGIVLDVSPDSAEGNHWRLPLWMPTRGIPVSPGSRLCVNSGAEDVPWFELKLTALGEF